jgi:hypothetical protein
MAHARPYSTSSTRRPHSFPRLDGVEAVRQGFDPVGTFLPAEG